MSPLMFNRKPSPAAGYVWLVGAGPGAVDLITMRGRKALSQADVVLHDDLANPELLQICPAGCEFLYVGKRAARTGRNPRTGDAIKIKAAKVPKFRPGKGLKDSLK